MVDGGSAFWGNSLLVSEKYSGITDFHHSPFWVKALPIAMTLLGLGFSWLMFIKYPVCRVYLSSRLNFLYNILVEKWYFDYIYDVVLVSIVKRIGKGCWQSIDIAVIDALGPEGVAATVLRTSRRASQTQTGYIFHYAFAMIIGVTLLLSLYFLFFGPLS